LTYPNADPKILEPVMTVEITIPPQFQTAVMGGIVKRRAFVKNTDTREDGMMVVEAEAPLSKMFGYATELRSNTQGQGEFSMEYLRLDPVAGDDAAELRVSYQEKLQREKGRSLDE
jgi:elongation factor G